MTLLAEYALAWHPQHGGRIRVKPAGQDWGQWIAVSSADLAAVSAVMRERPVDLTNGWLRTGAEPVGEEED